MKKIDENAYMLFHNNKQGFIQQLIRNQNEIIDWIERQESNGNTGFNPNAIIGKR